MTNLNCEFKFKYVNVCNVVYRIMYYYIIIMLYVVLVCLIYYILGSDGLPIIYIIYIYLFMYLCIYIYRTGTGRLVGYIIYGIKM